jgi:hypothetical protein
VQQEEGIAWAHNRLSRLIVYYIYYNSTLILPIYVGRGEGWLRLMLLSK